jgi:hypothetical protein
MDVATTYVAAVSGWPRSGRGRLGSLRGLFGALVGPASPKSTPNDPDLTAGNLKVHSHEL